MAEALGGDLVEQPGQLLAQPRVVLLGQQRTRAIALAVVLVAVDQVDVGGEIEFAAAQLAQGEHHQALWRSIGVSDMAMARGEVGLQRRKRELQALPGERGDWKSTRL